MPIPYSSADASNDFSNARVGAGTYIEYPLLGNGDTTAKIYHLICQVNIDDYVPIALDSTLSGATADVIGLPTSYVNATAYHIGDFNPQESSGGLITFDRRFATIPASSTKNLTGTIAYTFPGIGINLSDTIVRTATGFSSTSTETTLICANTVAVGDSVLCSLSTTSSGTNIIIRRTSRIALTGTNASQVVVDKISSTTTFTSGSVEQYSIQPRGSASLQTGTFTDFNYYLPGVTATITDPTDVPLSDTFRLQATLLGEGTIPSASEYSAKVFNGDLLTIDSSITTYAGNIIQRANVKVKAQ